ncbi:transporter [Nesidiocoris tenuis]|uniref:Transporter n=1 Tax=Nesidiocoris tenuis TaxID=355587 RepID=A0ABN7B1S0_9HEMI|nr:transporter [Nesidiocoris tenuis]
MNVDPPLVAEEGELEVNHGARRQIFATLAVSFAALNAGLTIGWTQTGKIDLSPGSNSTRDPDRHIALLVGSIVSVIVGTLLLLDSSTPAVGWWLSGSVIVTGITFGPMLLSEAVHRDTRGALMSVCLFQLFFGIFLAITVGSYLNPKGVGWCLTVLYMVQFLLIFMIAESPMFLVWASNRLRAEGSLFWYSGDDRSIARGQLSVLAGYYENNSKSLLATVKDVEIRNALGLLFVKGTLLAVGYWILVEFRIKMFVGANGSMSQNAVDILVASVQAVASLAVISLVDSFGRKNLMYASHVVNPCVMFCSWIYFAWIWSSDDKGFCWFPVFCSVVYTASYTVGLATYLSVLVNEVFPLPIKDITSTIAGLCVAEAALMAVWCRNCLDGYTQFGYDNLKYFIFTELSGCLWTWLYAQETRGKPLMNLRTW